MKSQNLLTLVRRVSTKVIQVNANEASKSVVMIFLTISWNFLIQIISQLIQFTKYDTFALLLLNLLNYWNSLVKLLKNIYHYVYRYLLLSIQDIHQ